MVVPGIKRKERAQQKAANKEKSKKQKDGKDLEVKEADAEEEAEFPEGDSEIPNSADFNAGDDWCEDDYGWYGEDGVFHWYE